MSARSDEKPVFLVLGAGAGIGGHAARRFAAAGYHAVLCRRSDEDGLHRLVARIEAEGGSATGRSGGKSGRREPAGSSSLGDFSSACPKAQPIPTTAPAVVAATINNNTNVRFFMAPLVSYARSDPGSRLV